MRNPVSISGVLLVLAALGGALALSAFGKDEAAAPASGSAVDIPTKRGVALKANVHRPAKGNGAAVVIAPGEGYHRDLPLIRRSAEALAESGFLAVRFDWAYFTAKGKAAEDRAPELADVEAAVAYAKAQGATKVLLAGKSLGSEVALSWSNANADAVQGLALLTFVVTDPNDPGSATAKSRDIEETSLAPLVITGDSDPLAELPVLFKLASDSSPDCPPQIVVVPGDHGLAGPSKNAAEQAENIELAVHHLVVWAKRRIARQPAEGQPK